MKSPKPEYFFNFLFLFVTILIFFFINDMLFLSVHLYLLLGNRATLGF